jgi:SAM-dependent methyltransferase
MTSSQNIHYDHIADVYVNSRRLLANHLYYNFTYQALLDFHPTNLANATVLECMSANGDLARVATNRVKALHIMDISEKILALVEDPTLYASRICGDALALPYADNQFDAIFIRGGLHHIHHQVESALTEFHRIIKPNGWLVCNEPADDNPLIYGLRELLHWMSPLYEPGEQGFKRDRLAQQFERVGFGQVSTEADGFFAYALIGNTDVFSWFANLENRHLIRLLLWSDDHLRHIPIIRRFSLAFRIRGQAIK